MRELGHARQASNGELFTAVDSRWSQVRQGLCAKQDATAANLELAAQAILEIEARYRRTDTDHAANFDRIQRGMKRINTIRHDAQEAGE